MRLSVAAVCLCLVLGAVSAADEPPGLRALLKAGDALLVQGRRSYPAAVAKYSEAVLLAPRDPKVLFRRAELYFMMRETTRALADLRAVVSLDPSHRKARETRAKLLAAQGSLSEAAADAAALERLWRAAQNGKKAAHWAEQATLMANVGAEWDFTEQRLNAGDPDAASSCVQVLGRVISQFALDNSALRLRRARCALDARQTQDAQREVKVVLAREPNNLDALVVASRTMRTLGATDAARAEVKRCLTLDPEYEPCIALHKQIRQYMKKVAVVTRFMDASDWEEAASAIEGLLQAEPDYDNLRDKQCQCFVHLRDVKRGLAACQRHLDAVGSTSTLATRTHLRIGDLHILDDDLEAAEEALRRAKQADPNGEGVREFEEKLETLKRGAGRKDYYAILGVKKTAGDKEIKKAFRHLAKQHHPDRLRSVEMTDAERKKADERFRGINEAKEMLLDKEKRQRYDNGEDVANPQQQQQQHQQHGGFHFPADSFFHGGGGGGFQFHFQ